MLLASERVFHLPYRHRLAVNLLAVVSWFFGRDERLTALMTLLRAEIEDVAGDDDESFDAMAGAISFQLIAEHHITKEDTDG